MEIKLKIMKLKLNREDNSQEVKRIYLEIGDNMFTLTETVDGKLNVNKVSIERNKDILSVFPRSGNEIQLTDAMAKLIGTQPFHGIRYEGTRFDCGDRSGYVKAILATALERPDLQGDITDFFTTRVEAIKTPEKKPAIIV